MAASIWGTNWSREPEAPTQDSPFGNEHYGKMVSATCFTTSTEPVGLAASEASELLRRQSIHRVLKLRVP
jgi:hypothetical protein